VEFSLQEKNTWQRCNVTLLCWNAAWIHDFRQFGWSVGKEDLIMTTLF